jgi:hypothetical protein
MEVLNSTAGFALYVFLAQDSQCETVYENVSVLSSKPPLMAMKCLQRHCLLPKIGGPYNG